MNFQPAGHEGNALVRTIFAVQYQNSLTNSEFEAIERKSDSWKEDLPRRRVTHAMIVEPQTGRFGVEGDRIASLAYEEVAKDGSIEIGLGFETNRILLQVSKYSKWEEIWPKAKRFLESATGLISATNSVAGYSMEHVNLFRAQEGHDAFSAAMVLRDGCRYVPSHVFQTSSNFHAHSGYFDKIDTLGPHRLLKRVNIDLQSNDVEKARDLSVTLFHCLLPEIVPQGESPAFSSEISDMGLESFQLLRNAAKETMREIVTDGLAEKIGLNR